MTSPTTASDTIESMPELSCYAAYEHEPHAWYSSIFQANRHCQGLDADTLFERTQDATL